MERVSEKFDGLGPGEDPILELRSTLMQVKDEVVRLSPLFLEDIQKFLPELWQRVKELRAEKTMKMENSIRAAQQMGIATGLDAHLATVIFSETVQALVTPESISRHGLSLNETVDALMNIFVSGIRHYSS